MINFKLIPYINIYHFPSILSELQVVNVSLSFIENVVVNFPELNPLRISISPLRFKWMNHQF